MRRLRRDDVTMATEGEIIGAAWADTDGNIHDGYAGETPEEQAAMRGLFDDIRRAVRAGEATPLDDPAEVARQKGLPEYIGLPSGQARLVAVGRVNSKEWYVYKTAD